MARKRQRYSETTSAGYSDDDDYNENTRKKKKTRQSKNERNRISLPRAEDITFSSKPLIDLLEAYDTYDEDFEEIILDILPDLLRAREEYLETTVKVNRENTRIRSFTSQERHSILKQFLGDENSVATRLIARKLKLDIHRRKILLEGPQMTVDYSKPLTSYNLVAKQSPNPEVLDGLYSIKTTPFSNSLLRRICGSDTEELDKYLARDWEAQSDWLDLLDDIAWHRHIFYPQEEFVESMRAPIDYQTLHYKHLRQIHDLLTRTFWPGIDISDALQYSPEKCTVVATYKSLVVGAVFLSSPQETYITYIVVRTGWENSQIATKMLYHLLCLNPTKDIILHVSANNSAMLLYNRFGFKAEEFIVGFYEDYLDSNSRASKNAFRLRLRR